MNNGDVDSAKDFAALDRALAIEMLRAFPVFVPPGMTVGECADELVEAIKAGAEAV